jgi:hypothetical protein
MFRPSPPTAHLLRKLGKPLEVLKRCIAENDPIADAILGWAQGAIIDDCDYLVGKQR